LNLLGKWSKDIDHGVAQKKKKEPQKDNTIVNSNRERKVSYGGDHGGEGG